MIEEIDMSDSPTTQDSIRQVRIEQFLARYAGDGGGCDCCGKEPSVGVASIPFVPMSIAWGRECLEAGVVPLWILVALIEMVNDGAAEAGVERRMTREQFSEVFSEDWRANHDRTIAYFGVDEDEFWRLLA